MSKIAKILLRRLLIGSSRFLFCFEQPEVVGLPINVNEGCPSSTVFPSIYTFNTRFVCFAYALVGEILRVCGGSNVFPPIIARVAILVVDLLSRPVARHDEPRKSICLINVSIYPDCASAIGGINAASFSSYFPTSSSAHFPRQNPGVWVVVEQAADVLSREVFAISGLSHFGGLPCQP